MNRKNAISQSSVLQGIVKVKKIRFKENTHQSIVVKPTRDSVQRQKNFQEFRQVYYKKANTPDAVTLSSSLSEIHYMYPRARKEPNYVETITLELPFNIGADRAIVQCKNKIKPKKSLPKVSREVLTEKTAKEIERPPEKATSTKLPLKSPRPRKEKITKTVTKIATPRSKKRPTKASTLSALNEKLKQLQKKYSIKSKTPYRSVNDCFTQIGNVEVLYENEKYPHEIGQKLDDKETSGNNLKEVSKYSLDSDKMRERIKEMDQLFPEFPKIEDTLKEIEIHLDNIVIIESCHKINETGDQNPLNYPRHDKTTAGAPIDADINKPDEICTNDDCLITEKILQNLDFNKGIKLRCIRRQIDAVEDVCHKLSQMVRDQHGGRSSEPLEVTVPPGDKFQNEQVDLNKEEPIMIKSNELNNFENHIVADFIEGPHLQQAVKKSSFLSKEMAQLSNNAMVKVFSDHQRRLVLREKQRAMLKNEKDELTSDASITKLIDSLRQTFDDSFYEPVGPK
ncbi:hypothetical protein GWI33_018073 [Rhynchophorus ferrugineus]|uniref:Uncharacterized protein n=1 Tax=Rhynchophorus ferrugineus TaxID=354439 RepID=A0A834HVD3_RHYFE|nr:hypothetical protein GWI33_018073 [Rhynchophorus ferrugineus]